MQMTSEATELRHTALHAWHIENGGRMGAFAGYDMPIRYNAGTIAEHNHTRKAAGLFDVSHMGVAELQSENGDFADVAAAFERFVPCDVQSIAPGRQRYTQLLNDEGGIIDDLMISRPADRPELLSIVSNAGRKTVVFPHLATHLPMGVVVRERPDLALIALQGPRAVDVLSTLTVEKERLQAMKFMDVLTLTISGVSIDVSRSGYTGEDGFELAVEQGDLVQVASAIMQGGDVALAGLGARDTLRLEAGLCLYGSDIDETTSPIEAGLLWSIQKRRRSELGFAGAKRIAAEMESGISRKLVALAPQSKGLVRDHASLFDAEGTAPIGTVTSGGFSPTLGKPVAMGYVPPQFSDVGRVLIADVRGNRIPVEVTTMPFVPHTYRR
jgi:aminomethyltransferase